jgi:hypothetical protein
MTSEKVTGSQDDEGRGPGIVRLKVVEDFQDIAPESTD